MKYVPPSVHETAFNCPHCGALAKQYWHSTFARELPKDKKPILFSNDDLDRIENDADLDFEIRTKYKQLIEKKICGVPFLTTSNEPIDSTLNVVWLSSCYNCECVSIWINDQLLYPRRGEAPPANPDLPADVRRDYDEASLIFDLSPRGAAALIRLSIQKLCRTLGQPGKNINADIKALVEAGLDPRIQKALDAVRVIGNNAVHPGEMDLRDDRATAETLFKLLNLIADKLISEPKHIDELYNNLPKEALEAIKKRDGGG